MTYQPGGEDAPPPSEFFGALRRLGCWRKKKLPGLPSDRFLARKAGVSPSTVGEWLRGDRFPQQVDGLLVVLQLLHAEAVHRGLYSGEAAALLDQQWWRKAYRAEAARRAQESRLVAERTRAQASLAQDERHRRLAQLPDRPRPLSEWSPSRLGVHPSITGDPGGDHTQTFVLPTYVYRPHDAELRAHLVGALARMQTLMVVVRGQSCTGKTRTAYEAVQAVMPDWDLLFPTTTDSLLAVLSADVLGPKTVLWLNEAQEFLSGADGEVAAAALRRALERPGPAVIIATLWPDHHHQLTVSPTHGKPDQHFQARLLLAQAQRVDVPAVFTTADLASLHHKARSDPSLATAEHTGAPAVTQVLAAGPDLVDHYTHPSGPHGPYGRAVITAAMDARRLGVTGPIPLALLKAAAPGYLTDQQRAEADPETWFTHALDYARIKLKGVTAALQDIPHPTGIGARPGVVTLADYLAQHGRQTRSLLCPPEDFWKGAADHCDTAANLTALIQAALMRWRDRHAEQLGRAAALAGHTQVLSTLAWWWAKSWDGDRIDRLASLAEDAADTGVLRDLARSRERAGDREAAERLYRTAVDAGDNGALVRLALLRERSKDPRGAEQLARRAADAGHASALWELARMRERHGQLQSAKRLYREAAEAEHTGALSLLAGLREQDGDREAAEQLAVRAAHAGSTKALRELAVARAETQDYLGAERLARLAADAGNSQVLIELARARERDGDRQDAERLYRAASDVGDTSVRRQVTQERGQAGQPLLQANDPRNASVVAPRAAVPGEEAQLRMTTGSFATDVLPHAVRSALRGAVRARERRGDRAGAEHAAHLAADEGDTHVLHTLAWVRERTGDSEGAERLYRAAADAGDPGALRDLAWMRERSGNQQAAEQLYRQAAEAGSTAALQDLTRMRDTVGDWDVAEQLALLAANGKGTGVLRRHVRQWEKAGDKEGAERLARLAADAGQASALRELALRRSADPQWRRVLRYGLEPDGSIAEPW